MSSFHFPDWQSDHRRGCALGFDEEEHIVEFLNMNVAIPRGLDINEEDDRKFPLVSGFPFHFR